MKQRNHTFDFLCGICIIIMITVHAITFCGHNTDVWWKNIIAWSYFFICFFFFKAGYFSKGNNENPWEFIRDKAKRLLIPYVSWGIIGFAIYAFFIPFQINVYGHPVEPMHWSHLWSTSSVWGNEPLWFLFSFFATYVLVHFISRIHIGKYTHPVQAAVFMTFPVIGYWLWTHDNPLPLNLNNIFIGAFFFYLGQCWRKCLEKLSRMKALAVCSVLIIAFIISNMMWHGEYAMSTNRFVYDPAAAIINMIIIMPGLSGFGISLTLPRIPLINFIGEHSLVFFVAHYPLMQFYRLTHISFGHSIYGRMDDFIILLILSFCFCSWIVPSAERIPWLSGRPEKSRYTEQKTS